MAPRSAVAESSGRDREDFRPGSGRMENTVAEFRRMKRRRCRFEIGLEGEPTVAPKHAHARRLVEEASVQTGRDIGAALGSDYDDDDDCVITGSLMPRVTLPRAPADRSVAEAQGSDDDDDDDDECVIVGARAGRVSAAVDDDCVIMGWSIPGAVPIRDSSLVTDGLLRALGADEEESSDSRWSECSVGNAPAPVYARLVKRW